MVARKALTAALLLLPVVASGVTTALLYRGSAYVAVDLERRYEAPFLGTGFHGREREGDRGFRWTSSDGFLNFDHLPVSGQLDVEARLKVIRPREEPLPLLRFSLDGVTVSQAPGAPGENVYRFTTPFRGPSVRLGIHADPFRAADSRELGVQVLRVELVTRDARWGFPQPVLWMSLASVLLLVTGFVVGVGSAYAARAALGLALVLVYLLSIHGLRFSSYPREVTALVLGVLFFTAALRALLAWLDWPRRSHRPLVLAILAGSLFLKLILLTYPFMVSSDADFHAHRLSDLLQGEWWLTSVSQHDPPFRIPYPASLYAVTAPGVALGLDRVTALELVTGVFDVLVGLGLLFVADRMLNDLYAGALAAVAYQLVPINALAFSAGNFSNLFGVSTAFLFLALLAGASSHKAAPVTAGVLSLLALTAHFSTFLMGVALWPIALVAVVRGLPPGTRLSPWRPWALAVVASMGAAFVYYSGYWSLLAEQWQRVLTQDYATGEAAVTGPWAKLQFNLIFYRQQLGVVFALLAVLGAVPLLARARASRLHMIVTVGIAVAALFFVADLMTALEVRYVLQAVPVLALCVGAYLSSAWRRGVLGRAAAMAAIAYLTGVGLMTLYDCMLYRYH